MGDESANGFDRRRSRWDGAAARRVKVRSTESIPLSPPDYAQQPPEQSGGFLRLGQLPSLH